MKLTIAGGGIGAGDTVWMTAAASTEPKAGAPAPLTRLTSNDGSPITSNSAASMTATDWSSSPEKAMSNDASLGAGVGGVERATATDAGGSTEVNAAPRTVVSTRCSAGRDASSAPPAGKGLDE